MALSAQLGLCRRNLRRFTPSPRAGKRAGVPNRTQNALTPQLVLDTAVGRSLRGIGTTIQGTIGLTWTVDVNKLLNR